VRRRNKINYSYLSASTGLNFDALLSDNTLLKLFDIIRTMPNYLIEFRFSGTAKKFLKSLIYEIAHKFRVRGAISKRAIPHITLVGPLQTRNQSRLVGTVREVCSKYDLVSFKLKGFGRFGHGLFGWLFHQKVVFVEIQPSEEMNQLRIELVKKLDDFCTLTKFDHHKDRHFHATLAFKDIDAKFKDIWNYVQNKKAPDMKQFLLRVTIIKDQKILYEYDFMQRKLLTRTQAKNWQVAQKTISIFKKKLKN